MSHTRHEAINMIPETGIGGHHYPPHSALTQARQGVSNFADGSGFIFSMYLELATEEDKKMVESWKADADGILIFTGLFSAAVASLISVSIQDIRPNPQDKSNFYLANIYQTLADPSVSIPTTSPPPFSPPNYAIWVNALWFLSLVISLTCALLATLLQQWARRYLKATQTRYAPHKRARIRAFLSEGIDKHFLPWTVEILPTLLHISLFLFFAGLVVFLWNVDLTIFKWVLSWVGICAALYGCITIMPIIRHDSPFHTPLSLPAWHFATGIQFLIFLALRRLALLTRFSSRTSYRFYDLALCYGRWLVQGMQKTVEEAALNSRSEIDTRAFLWTFDCLDEDHELEYFFSGLPGFRSSDVVNDPFPTLAEEDKHRLFTAMTGLLDRTFTSDLLPESVKKRRAIICTKAADPTHTPEAFSVLNKILSNYQFGDPLIAEIVQIVKGWKIDNKNAIPRAKATFFRTVARVQPHEDSWFVLASKSLGVPENVLRDHAAHGDSLSLVVLIHIVRLQFSHFRKQPWTDRMFSHVLVAASIFNVQDTSPELQDEFCALWNQIVLKSQHNDDRRMAFNILGRIRNVYFSLHRGTDSAPTQFSVSTGHFDDVLREPSSYPLCDVPGHHPNSTNNLHGYSAPHYHGNTARLRSSLSGSPYTPSSSPLSSAYPLSVEENLTEVPPRNNNISVPVSPQPIYQTESRRTPPTSPIPVTARAHRSIDTILLSSPKPSASTPPPKSRALASPPDAVDVKHSADSCAPLLDAPSSLSPTHVLPTESHSPIPAPGAPFPSRPLHSFAPDMDATAEGEGCEKDAPHPFLATREDNMADRGQPQPPSPAPIIDVTIAGCSRSSLKDGETVDHPPRPLHLVAQPA